MHKIGHNKYCHVTHEWTQYTFHNLRDFSWKHLDYTQEEHRITDTFDVSTLKGIDMIVSPFGPRNVIAHTMLTFYFSDSKSVSLSVEAQLDQWNDYNFWKATFRGYYNLYIRGTEKDHLWLRKLRKEHPIRYPLHLDNKSLQKLFVALVHNTNEAHTKHERYALLSNNCTSALWNTARKFFPLPRRHRTLLFAPWLPHFLKKKWALKLTEKTMY